MLSAALVQHSEVRLVAMHAVIAATKYVFLSHAVQPSCSVILQRGNTHYMYMHAGPEHHALKDIDI